MQNSISMFPEIPRNLPELFDNFSHPPFPCPSRAKQL